MIQQYTHFETWEDFKGGMWRKESKSYEDKEFNHIVLFTGDHTLYGNAMTRVITEWPYSCKNNLSNVSINRKAWIGHAACCIEKGWPEYLVRRAWWQLTDRQRILADNEAFKNIKTWEQKQKSLSTSKHGKTGVIKEVYQTRLHLS